MAKSIDQARRKWERKTENAGRKWESAIDETSQSDWASEVADFLGVSEGEVTPDWKDGVENVSASEFQSSVEGKADKWERNTRRGLTE